MDWLFWLVVAAFSWGIVRLVMRLNSKANEASKIVEVATNLPIVPQTTSKPEVLTNDWTKFQIATVTQVSHNVKLIRFKLNDGQSLGIKLGDHCRIRFMKEGKEVARSYTPCSPETAVGYFEIIFKIYPTGGVSQYMDGLKVGDEVEIRRRPGSLKYNPNEHRHIGLICGGTGITPMLQFVDRVLHDKNDKTKVTLITANSTIDDVLLEKELDAVAAEFVERFKLHYVVSRPPVEWKKGFSGRISPDVLAKTGVVVNDCDRVLICGPDPFNVAAKEALAANGLLPTQIYVF